MSFTVPFHVTLSALQTAGAVFAATLHAWGLVAWCLFWAAVSAFAAGVHLPLDEE